LRGELELVRAQWLKNVGKVMNDRSRQKDDLTCSPSKRARRVISRQDTSDLVPELYSPFFNIRTMSTESTAIFACLEEKLVE
jgi:gluconate kinase